MIDYKENIELLEKVIFNFLIIDDDNDVIIKPKNYDGVDKMDLVAMAKSYFFIDDLRQKAFREIKKYINTYHRFPSKGEIRDVLNIANINIDESEFKELLEVDLKNYSYDFLYTYTKAFILLRNLNSSMTDTLTYLKTTDIKPDNIDYVVNEVRNSVNDKLNLSFSKRGKGLNFADPSSHKQSLKSGTPSGFPFIDKVLGGGWNEKTIVVFQGRPKVGKTTVLSNIAARAYMGGVNVGVATLEVSKEKYVKKIGAGVLGIPVKTYEQLVDDGHLDIVKRKLDAVTKDKKVGELWVEEFQTGNASAIDIESYFLNIELQTGIKFKVIVVDYLNMMKSIRDHANSYGTVKAISEELRAVAIRNGWCIVSATQVKREAIENSNPGAGDVAESFGLIHTVDTLFGLVRPPLSSEMKFSVIVNRDDGFEGSYKVYNIEWKYNRLVEKTDVGSEFYSEEEDLSDLQKTLDEEYARIHKPSNFDTVDEPQVTRTFEMPRVQQVQPEKPKQPVSVHTGRKLRPLSEILSTSHNSILTEEEEEPPF